MSGLELSCPEAIHIDRHVRAHGLDAVHMLNLMAKWSPRIYTFTLTDTDLNVDRVMSLFVSMMNFDVYFDQHTPQSHM